VCSQDTPSSVDQLVEEAKKGIQEEEAKVNQISKDDVVSRRKTVQILEDQFVKRKTSASLEDVLKSHFTGVKKTEGSLKVLLIPITTFSVFHVLHIFVIM